MVTVKLLRAAIKNNFLSSIMSLGCFEDFPCHASVMD